MTNYYITNADTINFIYRNSGKDYNDFGSYQDCENASGFNYLMGYVSTDYELPIPISTGVCVPEECKPADMNELKPFLLPPINGYLNLMFQDIKGFDLKDLQLKSNDIKFDSPSELN